MRLINLESYTDKSVCESPSHNLRRDIIVNMKEVSSNEKKKVRAATRLVYGIHGTRFGKCLVGVCEKGMCHMSFFRSDSKTHLENFCKMWPNPNNRRDEEETRAMVQQIFPPKGNQSPEILLFGTPFQLRVWGKLLEVPKGDTISYSDLAESVKKPDSVRAVSNAVANNPVAYIVPCHRIIGKDGDLHGYRWGLEVKRAILEYEGALRFTVPKRVGFFPSLQVLQDSPQEAE